MAEQDRAREIAKRLGLLGPNGNGQYAVEAIRAYGNQRREDGLQEAAKIASRALRRRSELGDAAGVVALLDIETEILARIDQPQEAPSDKAEEPDG